MWSCGLGLGGMSLPETHAGEFYSPPTRVLLLKRGKIFSEVGTGGKVLGPCGFALRGRLTSFSRGLSLCVLSRPVNSLLHICLPWCYPPLGNGPGSTFRQYNEIWAFNLQTVNCMRLFFTKCLALAISLRNRKQSNILGRHMICFRWHFDFRVLCSIVVSSLYV